MINFIIALFLQNHHTEIIPNFSHHNIQSRHQEERMKLSCNVIECDGNNNKNDDVTILGLGSLLSKTSSKTTFSELKNFRLGRVHNYRRVFAHPASIFFQRNIVNYDTLEMSSLSAEYCPGASFVCSIFEVTNQNGEFMQKSNDNDSRNNSNDIGEGNFVVSMAFREREEEFDIAMVPYEDSLIANINDENLNSNHFSSSDILKKNGLLCCRSTDEKFIGLWGQKRFDENYKKYNIDTIWNWKNDSGLKPCGPYLRHCVLASMKMGEECYNSFLDETYLVDRKTTIRSYLKDNPSVMETLPPQELQERYGG